MVGSRLYKIAHCNYRNTTRPYPLILQVMNRTGALRQFVPKVVRRSSRAAFGYRASADRVLHFRRFLHGIFACSGALGVAYTSAGSGVSRLWRPHRVRHDGAAGAKRLVGPDGRIPRGLVLDFRIELGTHQHHDSR